MKPGIYDIRQFKPTLYLLLLLGIAGFALAVNSPGVFVLGWAATLFNAWLVRTGHFRPLSRWISNAILLAGVPLVIVESVGASSTDEVVWIGQYIVLLQIVKLYEQRANRDYAQLLVLGLLLMVAAAINTTSLTFGILLIFYLFLSLYCCLLFYLKTEADAAVAALSLPLEKENSAALRQDQRHLTRSMRRVATLVAAVAIACAVAVFLFVPRLSSGFLGGRQLHEKALTGFSTEVSFEEVARIAQSNEIIAYVRVWKDEQPVSGADTLWLRGMTLERYNGDSDTSQRPKWGWSHVRADEYSYACDNSGPTELSDPATPPHQTMWRQNIMLRPTGTPVLFAMAGPVTIKTQRQARVDFAPANGTLRSPAAMVDTLNYEVVSNDRLDPAPDVDAPVPLLPSPDPQIESFARRPEVSGINTAGSLASQRRRVPGQVDPLDGEIADHIEQYLRGNLTYTLDLTDATRPAGRDPIVAFLYDWKRGHCEYFAGAMTLMCQSLGMQARMVIGYKCDEFSNVGGQYIVRQSDAHSWVEVRTAQGWKRFDPTSGTPADIAVRSKGGFFQPLEHLVDYLQFAYASKIIAYDNDDRQNLIEATETQMARATTNSRGFLDQLNSWTATVRFWKVSSTVIGAFAWLAVLGVLAAIGMFVAERWRLGRRAVRIGIDSLPPAEKQRLSRQLAFYDNLIRMLGRYQLVRPPHLTPLEFVESLLFLPTESYQTILRLTMIFYRVRFGTAELSAGQKRRLETVLARLNEGIVTQTDSKQP